MKMIILFLIFLLACRDAKLHKKPIVESQPDNIQNIAIKSNYIKKQLLSNNNVIKNSLVDSVRASIESKFIQNIPMHSRLFVWCFSVSKFYHNQELKLALSDIQRTPANIKFIFESYKKNFYSKISKDMYEEIGGKKMVKNLLESYLLFDKNVNLEEIKQLNMQNNVIEYFANIAYPELQKDKNYILPRNYQYTSWLYSFWYRRYMEGNKEIVYQILNEINNYYEK